MWVGAGKGRDARGWPFRDYWYFLSWQGAPMLVYVRSSNEERSNSSPLFSEAAGVVSTARIEGPPLYRGASAST